MEVEAMNLRKTFLRHVLRFHLNFSNWPAFEHAHRLIDACVLANRCDIEACQMY